MTHSPLSFKSRLMRKFLWMEAARRAGFYRVRPASHLHSGIRGICAGKADNAEHKFCVRLASTGTMGIWDILQYTTLSPVGQARVILQLPEDAPSLVSPGVLSFI